MFGSGDVWWILVVLGFVGCYDCGCAVWAGRLFGWVVIYCGLV